MPNAYGQVLRVYLRRPFKSLATGASFVAAGLLALSSTLFLHTPHIETALPQLGIGMYFLNLSLWLTFYEQVVGTRRRLWPGFVTPQLTVFAGLSVAWMILNFLILDRCANASPTGVIAFIALFFAVFGVVLALHSVLATLLAMSCFLWIVLDPGDCLVAALCTGHFPNGSLIIVLGSFVLIALALWRLFTLSEENSAYHAAIRLGSANLQPRMTGDGNQAWARLPETGFRSYVRALGRPRVYAGNSAWHKIQRWRYQNGWYLVGIALLMTGGSVVTTRFLFGGAASHPTPNFIILFLVVMVCGLWTQRWKYVATELLRPVTRDVFFKELGLAMMIDFIIALIASVLAMALTQLFSKRSEPVAQPFTTGGLMCAGLVTFTFGLTAWALRRRSQILSLIGLLLVASVSGIAAFASAFSVGPHFLSGSACASAFALVGIGLAVRAYRLWLTTELG